MFLAPGLLALVCGCANLPTNVARKPSTALADTDDTRLGRAIADRAAANPGKTGIYALPDGRDAFAAVHKTSDSTPTNVRFWPVNA